jgi:hypothetical protein
MANKWIDAIGTSLSSFIIGLGNTGVRLKNTAGNLVLRNKADSADVTVTTSRLLNSGDNILINSDAAGSGNDWTFQLSRNPTQTAALELQAPAAKGTDGYVLRQKAGTAAGVVELEFAAPGGTSSGTVIIDTTSLAFGTSSPLTLFTLPSGAIVSQVEVVIDTAFDGAPSLSVGIAGTTSKYLAATHVDLTELATTSFVFSPNLPAPGSDENLIATYSAGGASDGAARILISYVTPV